MDRIDTSIQYIKGVGPRKSTILARVGIKTVEDLLYYLPFRYEDRSNIVNVSNLLVGTFTTVEGRIRRVESTRTKGGVELFHITLDDGTGIIHAVWFNQPYLRKVFKAGQNVVMYGKVERYDRLQMNHPQYEILDGLVEKECIHVGRIVPLYPLTRDLAQRYMRLIVYRAMCKYAKLLTDILPTRLRAHNRLVDINFAVRNIHFPLNTDNLKRAYRRIVFDEFFLLQLAIAMKKRRAKTERKGISHCAGEEAANDFLKSLPFELTPGQKEAIKCIRNDMRSPRPMNRLIQGDVGSGKTVVAAYALLIAAGNGFQAAIMVPTEILAEQHYVTLNRMLMKYDINIVLLIQGLSAKTKRGLLDDIKDGRADVVIGTHALIQQGVKFENLGLVVIDEQHKFGVSQRAVLQKGARAPDTLLMTATPIPRTLALTVYGDLDMSAIRELPPGRGEITTYWVSDSQRERIYDFLREEISKGRQAYIVYPRLKEAASGDIKTARFMYEELKENIFNDLRVRIVHGKMKPRQKDSVMKAFKNGEIDILVSTVIIEVGIDVPNVSVMVIENAERFGLSQLHQLRGRIGRGPYESYCILVSDGSTEAARKRLNAMAEAQDGFEIAEEDLKLRGPGDIFGTRQHGLPEIRFGNIVRDMELMELARKEAFALIERDPALKNYENRFIKIKLDKRFRGRPSFIRVG